MRNRNINYTNVCTFKCKFCAFSKGPLSLNLRGNPYLLDHEEIQRRVVEAVDCGATEVCLQGGIHPDFDGDYYLSVARAVKEVAPQIHVHGFTALEVTEGARRLGMPLRDYLVLAKEAGLATLPGTAAEILDDEVRAIICPDKIDTEEWLDAHRTAHSVGLRSNVTIMFGHVERPEHVARHLVRTRGAAAGDRRVHRVRAAAVRAHGHADLPPAEGPQGPDHARGAAHARGRAHRLPRLDRQRAGLVGEDRRHRRAPGAAGRVQRPRRHADGREHLRAPRAPATARSSTSPSCAPSSSRSVARSSSAPRSTAARTPRAGGSGRRPKRSRPTGIAAAARRVRSVVPVTLGGVAEQRPVVRRMSVSDRLDVVGIGNALVDVLSHETHEFLAAHDLTPGAMALIDTERAESLYAAMGPAVEISGGSAANTLVGVASFGGSAAFIGRVADDELGAVFGHDIRAAGVEFRGQARVRRRAERSLPHHGHPRRPAHHEHLSRARRPSSGRPTSTTSWSPARRCSTSRATSGTSPTPRPRTASPPAPRTTPATGSRSRCPTRSASTATATSSSSWSSPRSTCCSPTRPRSCRSTRSTSSTTPSQRVQHHCEIAALTRSEKGAVIVARDEVHVVDAHPVAEVVDTTGRRRPVRRRLPLRAHPRVPPRDRRPPRRARRGRGHRPPRGPARGVAGRARPHRCSTADRAWR